MIQVDLFAAPQAPTREPADALDHELRAASLPYETRVEGARFCRHHPDQRIPVCAAPCVLCRRAGAEDEPGTEVRDA